MLQENVNQRKVIERLLSRFKAVDAYKVMKYWNIMRLASIINRLRNDGWKIETEMRDNAKGKGQHALYKLISKPDEKKDVA